MQKLKKLLLCGVFAFAGIALVGCTAGIAPAPPAQQWSYDDTWASVDQSFPEPWLNPVARCIVQHEGGGNPNARNGQYRSSWQIGNNYNGTISVTNDGNIWNPYTASMVARIIFDARGNWSAWSTARGCGG